MLESELAPSGHTLVTSQATYPKSHPFCMFQAQHIHLLCSFYLYKRNSEPQSKQALTVYLLIAFGPLYCVEVGM